MDSNENSIVEFVFVTQTNALEKNYLFVRKLTKNKLIGGIAHSYYTSPNFLKSLGISFLPCFQHRRLA